MDKLDKIDEAISKINEEKKEMTPEELKKWKKILRLNLLTNP